MKALIHSISEFIVKQRRIILLLVIAAAAAFGLLSLKVEINSDMTKYLPDNSSMKKGIDLMADEFSDLSMPSTIRVMLKDLPEEEADDFRNKLSALEGVDSVSLTGRSEADGAAYTLFTVGTSYEYRTDPERNLEAEIKRAGEDKNAVVRNDDTMGMDIPLHLYVIVVIILLAVLFAMCGSYLEPILFLLTIGAAILLNLGTNLILRSVSQTTFSMAAILQLILSMDYSIILMNRYRQEKQYAACSNEECMVRALEGAFASIAGSALTTIAGLLMLIFMQFKIGLDLGIVLAKGVFLSMLCVWFFLPGLILIFDSWIEKTKKKVLPLPAGAAASFCYRFRYFLCAGFVLLFAVSFELQRHADVSYSLAPLDPIADIFPPANPIIILYSNEDEEEAAVFAQEMDEDPAVDNVFSYGYSIGRKMTAAQMADFIADLSGNSFASQMLPDNMSGLSDGIGHAQLGALYALKGVTDGEENVTMSVEELIGYAVEQIDKNPLFAAVIDPDLREQVSEIPKLLETAKKQLKGEKHSLMMLQTSLPVESEETSALIEKINGTLTERMSGDWYLIGNSPMNVEMEKGFKRELWTITILTAASIFLVVLITFRNLCIPIVLVSLVQCGVYLTVTTTRLLGYSMYYLAILIVQCILMGATVDYGILFTSVYREQRAVCDEKGTALANTYQKCAHTILTSGLFMIFGTGALGVAPVEPTISQICKSIALGAISATVLVLLVLPGILSALDKYTSGKNRK